MKIIKPFLLAFIGLFITTLTYSAAVNRSSTSPPEDIWQFMKASEFITFSAKDYTRLTGEKMNMKERISFNLLKLQLKKELKTNPSLTVGEFMASSKKMKKWLKIVLIIVGVFLLAFIIFAIAYGGGF